MYCGSNFNGEFICGVCSEAGGMDIKIFLDIDNGELSPPPEGTLFFEKVEVLE